MKTNIYINGVKASRKDWNSLFTDLKSGKQEISQIRIEEFDLYIDTEGA